MTIMVTYLKEIPCSKAHKHSLNVICFFNLTVEKMEKIQKAEKKELELNEKIIEREH